MYVFRTRLPVASICIATDLLPHDLHVLSLPLAFILSQDQTLHCKCCLILTVKNSQEKIKRVKSKCYSLDLPCCFIPMAIGIKCYCFPTFKDLLAIKCHPFYWECKGNGRSIYHQKYLAVFSSLCCEFQLVLQELLQFFSEDRKNTSLQWLDKLF